MYCLDSTPLMKIVMYKWFLYLESSSQLDCKDDINSVTWYYEYQSFKCYKELTFTIQISNRIFNSSLSFSITSDLQWLNLLGIWCRKMSAWRFAYN